MKRRIIRLIRSLRFRIIVPVSVIIVTIVIVLTAMASNLYTNTQLNNEAEKTMAAFDLIGESLYRDLISANIEGLNLLLQNNVVKECALNQYPRQVSRIVNHIHFKQAMTEFLFQHNVISGILFFRDDGSLFGMVGDRVLFYDEPICPPEKLAKLISPGTTMAYKPARSVFSGDQKLEWLSERANSVVSVRRVSVPTLSVPLYVLVLVDLDDVSQYLAMQTDLNGAAFLLAADGSVILASPSEAVLSEAAVQIILSGENTPFYRRIKLDGANKSEYLCCKHIDELDWYLVREISLLAYESRAHNMRLAIWAAACLLMLVALQIALSWMKGLVRDFYVLRSGIVRTGHGYLQDSIQQSFRVTEFDEVRSAFNSMNRSLDQLIRTKQRIEREQAETELKNLQMQLSPHMVFNSLTAIRWMAVMTGDDKVADMLVELAAMMQPVFREWTMSWTLGQEMDHLEHYARLLDLRFGNHFKMVYDVPDALKALIIPRFTLQPLVENACEHGSVPQDGCLRVVIKAIKTDEAVTLTVRNNGESMSPETLEVVRSILEGDQPGGKVGLHNVYYRLRLCLGENSHMKLENVPEGGTIVTISWKPDNVSESPDA